MTWHEINERLSNRRQAVLDIVEAWAYFELVRDMEAPRFPAHFLFRHDTLVILTPCDHQLETEKARREKEAADIARMEAGA